MKLPRVLCSTVIRETVKNDTHGRLIVVNLEKETFKTVWDYKNSDIEWGGRGKNRGLRGIEYWQDSIFVAGSKTLYELDQKFKIKNEYSHRYLSSLHEITENEGKLWVASTGNNCLIRFDLENKKFDQGFHFDKGSVTELNLKKFEKYPDVDHINNVFSRSGKVVFSGKDMRKVYRLVDGRCKVAGRVPRGTHNVQLHNSGLIMNDTRCSKIVHQGLRYDQSSFKLNVYRPTGNRGFARGLAVWKDFVVGGTCPATVSIYNYKTGEVVKSIKLSDNRHEGVHGLEIFPPQS